MPLQPEHRAAGGPERTPMLGSTPVHTSCRYSLLSSERAWHEKQTGLYNLALIIIVVTNFRSAQAASGCRLSHLETTLSGGAGAGRGGGGGERLPARWSGAIEDDEGEGQPGAGGGRVATSQR